MSETFGTVFSGVRFEGAHVGASSVHRNGTMGVVLGISNLHFDCSFDMCRLLFFICFFFSIGPAGASALPLPSL